MLDCDPDFWELSDVSVSAESFSFEGFEDAQLFGEGVQLLSGSLDFLNSFVTDSSLSSFHGFCYSEVYADLLALQGKFARLRRIIDEIYLAASSSSESEITKLNPELAVAVDDTVEDVPPHC